MQASISVKASAAALQQQRPLLTFKQRNEQFRTVLAFDGGALRGVLCAGLLEGVEDAIKTVARRNGLTGVDADGKEWKVAEGDGQEFDVISGDYFDVVAGTSTGSILATYVSSKGANTVKLQDSPEFQREVKVAAEASNIFPYKTPPRTCCEKLLAFYKKLTTPRHPAVYEIDLGDDVAEGGLEPVLRSAFGGNDVFMTSNGPDGKPLLKTSLIITSYQLDYNRPFLFYYDRPDGVVDGKGASGYGALRRTLTVDQEAEILKFQPLALIDRGASDLVRVEKPFRLWQTVRASTAAPTLFPTAAIDNLVEDPKTNQPVVEKNKPTYQMTDGGLVANNPTMVATTFAATKYDTQFVGVDGKPSLAVLSLGCGNSTKLNSVDQNAGPYGWVLKGPLIDILGEGAGELAAALNQQLARDWPGSKQYQVLRVQLSAGVDEYGNDTISFSRDVVTLPKSGSVDPHVAPFVRALADGKGRQLDANVVLKGFDVIEQKNQLLGLGYAVARDDHVREKLETWVESFVLSVP